MNTQIKEFFHRLNSETEISPNKKCLLIIDYLKSVLESSTVTDFEDIGFCLWNISDNLALLRSGNSLIKNHMLFYEHIKTGNSSYLFWAVNDATQRLTLEKYGYSEFWQSLYAEAVERNKNSNNYSAEFHSHRAALYISPYLPYDPVQLETAKENFEYFLKKSSASAEHRFYRTVYLALISRFSPVDKSELQFLCEEMFCKLSVQEKPTGFLTGEWQSFALPAGIRRQAAIAVNEVINAFIYSGDIKTAEKLYREGLNHGLPSNRYIEKRLK